MKYFILYQMRPIGFIVKEWTYIVFDNEKSALSGWRSYTYMLKGISENKRDVDNGKYGKEVLGPFPCNGEKPTQAEIDYFLRAK